MEEAILNLVNTFEFQTVFRLVLCVILAGFLGHERKNLNKPAGTRTHMLLGICGCLIMMCGEYLSEQDLVSDATRIPAQLLSGIGFIGAGAILKDGVNVRGLTTATSLLATTCIGLSVGAGFYIGAIVATLFIYLVLVYPYKFGENPDGKTKLIEFHLRYKETYDIEKIQKLLEESKCEINYIRVQDNEHLIIIKGKCADNIENGNLVAKLVNEEDIIEVVEG